MNQENIQASVETSGAVTEFRVLKNFALLGYYYHSLQVYEDDTAKFTFMVYHGEYFDDGELLLDESRKLSVTEAKQLLACFEKNDFWNIPTVHPDENRGLDGCTVFIEGKSGSKTHFISMWEPETYHGINKIFSVFDKFSETIAENPFEEYAW